MHQSNQPVIPEEEQFKIMANIAPVMMWISGVDKLCYFFNTGWLIFTGRTMDQEYGNGWTEGIHPDDLQQCLATYNAAFDNREEFKMKYRLMAHDGEYHWLLNNGVPRYTADGSFAGYIGSCVDIDDVLESERVRSEYTRSEAIEREQLLNEELAATNEELSAANEELRASWGDLEKLNAGLEKRVVERTRALKESESNFRNLILQAPVAIAIFRGSDHIVEIANTRALELWGKTWKEVSGRPILETMPELSSQGIKELLGDVYKTGKTFSASGLPVKLMRNGEMVTAYIDFIYEPLYNADGEINGLITIGSEVTEQVTARKKVERAEESLRMAIDAAELGAYYINTTDRIFHPSPRLKEFFGFGHDEEVPYEAAINQIHPDYRQAAADLVETSITKGTRFDMEYPVIGHNDGKTRWVRGIGEVQHDSDGKRYFTGVVHDITEQKQSDIRQARLAAIIESSDDAIISKTLDGIITSWNESAEKMFGHTAAEAVGRHISLIIPKNRMTEEHLIIDKVRRGEKLEHFETVRITKTGEEIAISLTVSPIKNKNGEVIGASKIARDIGKQKMADERLQNYAERLEILNSVGLAISADLDTQGVLQKVTDATTQLTGASFGAFFHNLVNEHGESYTLYTLSGAPREAFEKFGMPRNTAVFGPTFSGEGIVRVDDITKDPRYGKNSPHFGMPKGHLPVVSYLAVPVVSKSGSVIGGLFFGHVEAGKFTREHEQLVAGLAAQAAGALDNAKLYEEVKVLNAKKDEFIGLASHELKTPITSINGYLQIIERNLLDGDRHKSFVSKALQQVNKLTMLISDLLDVSKIQTGKLPFSYTTFNMVELLQDVTEMMQHSYASHLIELHFDQEVMTMNADQQRMEQVVINLITNAVKYSPRADRIIINASVHDEKIRVSVQDFGIGIAQGHQERIFSRFYRVENLASHMSGLGIGLYICQEIVDRHHGKMWVRSKPGEGSTFYFEVPVGTT